MALQSTTIHQYDWLVKASSHQTCLQHTQSSSSVSGVSLNGKHEKLELDQNCFQFGLKEGKVKPALEHW